ncbi:LLM class flavin-dependent oxidoreductase [Hymenobacter jeollabukensis]|uniref:Luciferase-like monooxygenase n=1 Tax=Hymenobacter jeollabukensis TaxID=2025313 RepID=A0A5R8WN05_9BACT|nr:LLM class flavin-dependent oxidoreductase [Hymenobacter jeollabukensis]TLM91137.1 LLM class flavin-dependent oxidoreductase [Hymenobacter jeollabukensis]
METTPQIRLSVLDQSPVRPGATPRQAVLETVQLAQLADRLGYQRFWVSEHHNTPFLAGTTPEVLIAHLAGQTERIRVGSGGVMLPHYSALKVAENFRMLETLFPGRIDLGIGRAPGSDRFTAHVLSPGNQFSDEEFAEQLMDLKAFLLDEEVPDTIHAKVKAMPQAPTVPEPWLLSSSGQSGLYAAHLGMAFSFAQFINPNGGPKLMQLYRDRFKPSAFFQRPTANVAVFVLCADTEQKADELRAAMELQMLRIEQNRRGPFPSYAEARDYPYTAEERGRLAYNRGRILSGTPAQLREQLTDVARSYQVEEIVVVTITADFQDRLRSYELLAEAFELVPAALPAR